MKWIFFTLILLLPYESYTAPIRRDELKNTVVDLYHLVKEQSKELVAAQEANHALDAQLHLAQAQLVDTQQQLSGLTSDVKKLQKWAAETEIKRQDAMDAFYVLKRKSNAATEHVHRLKWMICGALAFFSVAITARFSTIFQGLWAFVLPLIAGAAAFLGTWIVL
jgi:hypothetical protein